MVFETIIDANLNKFQLSHSLMSIEKNTLFVINEILKFLIIKNLSSS